MKQTKTDYTESKKRWYAWRERQDDDPIYGFCNWEYDFGNFKLECWNVLKQGSVIFQFWPDGHGFHTYETKDRGAAELADINAELLAACRMAKEELILGGDWHNAQKIINEAIKNAS